MNETFCSECDHVQPETRKFYGLERLWGDAETEEIHDET